MVKINLKKNSVIKHEKILFKNNYFNKKGKVLHQIRLRNLMINNKKNSTV